MSTITAYGALAGAVLLAGWAGVPAHAQVSDGFRVTEVSESSHPYSNWNCARQPIEVRMVGQFMEVMLGSESRLLLPAVSASGARYVAPGDADTEFWSKGGLANLSWSGKALPVCAQEGTLVTPLRASGNEPFWVIDYDGWRVSLREPGQEARQFEIEGQERSTAGWRLQTPEGEMPLRLDIAEVLCTDTMSGMPRPYSVSLTMNQQTLQGCGGDPARLLQGVRWTLHALGDEAMAAPAWLEFLPDGRIAGSNGCNRLMGGYTITGEGMTFSQLGSTRMACAADVMKQASVVDEYLSSVRGFSFDAQGALVLITGQGELTLQAGNAMQEQPPR